MIDAKFFPHVIDEIFAHASGPALLKLRVNREWRRRAERKLAYHICVAETVADTESLPRKTSVIQSPEGDILGALKTGSHGSSAPSFLSSAVIVDLHVPKVDKKVAPILTHCSTEVVLRSHKCCPINATSGFIPRARRVVLFCKDDSLYSDDDLFGRYRLHRIPGRKHVVLHVRSKGRAEASHFLDIRDSIGDLDGLTLILQPKQSTQYSFEPYSVTDLVVFEIGFLADFVVLAYVRNVPVTVVNLACRRLDNAHQAAYNYESVKEALLDRIEFTKRGYTSHPVASVYTPVRFLSLDEYRAEVGEELFQIDTNEGRLWPPHLLYQ